MFSVEQKLDCVKLMVNKGYTNKQIIEISGAGPTAVARRKKQLRRVNNTMYKSCVICLIALAVVITTSPKISQ
jgi:hypothetical protein